MPFRSFSEGGYNMYMQERKNFVRRKEDFVCEHCGQKVIGDGYTDHCPKCLYSKHVDNVPGDRENDCGGLMKPIRAEQVGQEIKLVYKCLDCDGEFRVKISKMMIVKKSLK